MSPDGQRLSTPRPCSFRPSAFTSLKSVSCWPNGVIRRRGRSSAIFRDWLESQVLSAFDGRILPLDVAVVRRAAKLHVPDPQPINDAFIAATALVHGMTVATRILTDFATTGVPLVSPWEVQNDR
jgi:predicted nucleic acid-binding protein